MPLYEFTCRSCGASFEELVHSGSTVVCAKCGSGEVEKQFSAFAVGRGGGSSSSRRSQGAAPSAAPAPT